MPLTTSTTANPLTTSGTPVVELTGLQTADEANSGVSNETAPSKTAGDTGAETTNYQTLLMTGYSAEAYRHD